MGTSMRSTFYRACALVPALMICTACPEEDNGEDPIVFDAGPGASACPVDTPEFTVGAAGLSVTDEAMNLKVRVEAADYVPPRFGINSWTVAITDLADQPLPQAKLVWACAFMPAHGHGSNPRAVEKLDDKLWQLDRQNMSMQGGWEIRLWIDPAGTGSDFTGAAGGINSDACRAPNAKPATLTLRTCVPRKADEG